MIIETSKSLLFGCFGFSVVRENEFKLSCFSVARKTPTKRGSAGSGGNVPLGNRSRAAGPQAQFRAEIWTFRQLSCLPPHPLAGLPSCPRGSEQHRAGDPVSLCPHRETKFGFQNSQGSSLLDTYLGEMPVLGAVDPHRMGMSVGKSSPIPRSDHVQTDWNSPVLRPAAGFHGRCHEAM